MQNLGGVCKKNDLVLPIVVAPLLGGWFTRGCYVVPPLYFLSYKVFYPYIIYKSVLSKILLITSTKQSVSCLYAVKVYFKRMVCSKTRLSIKQPFSLSFNHNF
jgi:hypothetical protein